MHGINDWSREHLIHKGSIPFGKSVDVARKANKSEQILSVSCGCQWHYQNIQGMITHNICTWIWWKNIWWCTYKILILSMRCWTWHYLHKQEMIKKDTYKIQVHMALQIYDHSDKWRVVSHEISNQSYVTLWELL